MSESQLDRPFPDAEHPHKGSREMNALIVGRTATGLSTFA